MAFYAGYQTGKSQRRKRYDIQFTILGAQQKRMQWYEIPLKSLFQR